MLRFVFNDLFVRTAWEAVRALEVHWNDIFRGLRRHQNPFPETYWKFKCYTDFIIAI